jgi:predicted MFS family arabinose efflux permease
MTEHLLADRATYRAVLADPRFRAVFASRGLSIAAETLRILALSVLVFSLTGSPLLGAIAFGAGFLPQAIGGVLLSAVTDRVAPRRLIVGGYLLESATAVVLALARLPVGWCLVLVATIAGLTPVFTGATSRVVADVLTGDAYVLGRSLMGIASSAAQLLGLAGGGIAVAALGPRHALVVSAAGNLLAALWARFGLRAESARHSTRSVADRPAAAFTVRDSWQGSVELLRDRTVRGLMLAQWLPPTLITGGEALLVPYAGARGFPAGAAGTLLAALPIGMLVGDLMVGRFVRPTVREQIVTPLVVVLGAPLPFLLARPPLVVVVALLVLSGTGFAYTLGIQRQFLAALPDSRRGQAFTLLSTGLMTLQGLGPILAGTLAEWSGPAVAISVAGLATIATTMLMPRQPTKQGASRPL